MLTVDLLEQKHVLEKKCGQESDCSSTIFQQYFKNFTTKSIFLGYSSCASYLNTFGRIGD